jgi:putative membrane protein
MLYGFHDERLWTALAVLVFTLIVALSISTLAARMQRSWSMKRLHPVLPS